MASKVGNNGIEASVATYSKQNVLNLNSDLCSCGGSGDSSTHVFVELFMKVSPLRSEDPETILNLCVQVDEVFELGLVDDRSYVMRILPLVSGSVLRFFGKYLRAGNVWTECKGRLLEEYFPHFVRERLFRELIVFNFHQKGKSLRGYVELQLVDRTVMNLHPSVRDQAAIFVRPR